MGGLNGGNLFRNAPVSTIGSDIYVVDTIRVLTDEESKLNEDIINELLNDIKVYNQEGETVTFDDTDTHATLASYVEKTTAFVTSESEVVEGTTYNYSHYYFVLKLSQNLDGDKLFAKVKDYDLTSETSLNGVLEIFFSDINDDYDSGANSLGLEKVKTYIDLKKVETYSNEQTFRWEKVTLATFISTLIVTVYFLIRYRLSRGLASLVFPIAASAVTLGLMLIPGLIGLALPSSTAILVPMTTLFAYMVIVIISSKERDLIADDKGSRDNSLEHRQEISRKAVAIGYTSLIEASVLGAYLAIDFFGFGPSVYSYIFLAILFGVLISHFFITGTYLPLANVFYKWFSKINFEIKPRKNKKTNVVKTKSAEPEEAIFIGIND